MRNKIGIVLIMLVVFISCKKTKLDGDLAPLVGTWEWQYMAKYSDGCEQFLYDSLITHSPALDGFTYSMEFEKKGLLVLRKNGKKEDCYRLVSTDIVSNNFGTIFYFRLNNKKKRLTSFRLFNSVLTTTDFPEEVKFDEDGCQSIYSVFIKK